MLKKSSGQIVDKIQNNSCSTGIKDALIQFFHSLIGMSLSGSEISEFHLHLVSDSTGETLNIVARAATAYYTDFQPIEHIYALVRTNKQLETVLNSIESKPGIVFFTLIDKALRHQLEDHCAKLSIPCISILDPIIASLSQFLNAQSHPQIGRQHALTPEYFRRIDALNFTMSHDDGQHAEELNRADLILVGVSRTSKTPTSIYLAQRGIRTANIPIIPEIALPEELLQADKPLIVGLVASAERIAQIRRQRILSLNETAETPYIDRRQISDEIAYVRKICLQRSWPIIDVTRRSVEETAATIMNLLHQRNSQRS